MQENVVFKGKSFSADCTINPWQRVIVNLNHVDWQRSGRPSGGGRGMGGNIRVAGGMTDFGSQFGFTA